MRLSYESWRSDMPEMKRYKATVTAVFVVELNGTWDASDVPGYAIETVARDTVCEARTVSVEIERV